MPKRKRNEAEDTPGESKQPPQVKYLLDHGKKKIVQSLKLAQRFERQKLSRRLKTATARKDNADVARINSEIQALKVLDVSSTAERHLYKVLLKIKSVASSPALPQCVHTVCKTRIDNATGNIMARLFKAQVTREAMDEVLESVRQALGAVAAPNQRKKGQDAPQGKEISQSVLTNHTGGAPAPLLEEGSASEEVSDEEEFKGFGDDAASCSSDDFAQYDHRLASSDDDGEEDSSLLRDGADSQLRNELRASIWASDRKIVSASPSPQPEEAQKIESTKRIPMASTFLPSLTTGGYFSGSESEATDIEEGVAPRKNRRGQKARQAIWEKKYGETAKHVQNSKKSNKNEGWDARRGAVSKTDGRWRGGSKDKKRIQSDNPNLEEVKKKLGKRDDEGPLHPSWEAAKKAKEHKPIAAFQGKKIVFD